jgi:hypothetical protein
LQTGLSRYFKLDGSLDAKELAEVLHAIYKIKKKIE